MTRTQEIADQSHGNIKLQCTTTRKKHSCFPNVSGSSVVGTCQDAQTVLACPTLPTQLTASQKTRSHSNCSGLTTNVKRELSTQNVMTRTHTPHPVNDEEFLLRVRRLRRGTIIFSISERLQGVVEGGGRALGAFPVFVQCPPPASLCSL